jgi:hypothetical protein
MLSENGSQHAKNVGQKLQIFQMLAQFGNHFTLSYRTNLLLINAVTLNKGKRNLINCIQMTTQQARNEVLF